MTPAANDARASVRLRKVHKAFGRTTAVRSVDLDVEPGEFVALVGPSGCGKSTLLRLIAGLETTTSGQILIGGRDVTRLAPSKRGVAMAFQSYALYPHMSAYENMAFGMKGPRAGRAERVRAIAEMLAIDGLLDRSPRQLSGGQRQRVAIGRAILRDPDVFLFDEPLSNLDATLRTRMRAEIARLHRRLKTTTVYVTHDQVEAMTLADRIVVMNGGGIEQIGRPLDLYARPETAFVAGFIGSPAMNFIEATFEAGQSGAACRLEQNMRVELPGRRPAEAGGLGTIGLRPEHVRFAEAGLAARVEFVDNIGEARLLHLLTEGGARLIARRPGDGAERVGEAVRIALDPDRCHAFDAAGRALPRAL